jgi:hypothetical protein
VDRKLATLILDEIIEQGPMVQFSDIGRTSYTLNPFLLYPTLGQATCFLFVGLRDRRLVILGYQKKIKIEILKKIKKPPPKKQKTTDSFFPPQNAT